MSRIIECHVNDEYILGSGVPIGAAGSHDDVALRLIFNEMWDGLNIVATFKDALAKSETVIQLMPSMLEEGDSRTYLIWIPGGAKKYAGRVKLTLSGYSVYAVEENGTRIYKKDSLTNTATAFFRVLESDAAIVKDDEDSETTYKEIVQAELNAFDERMTAFEDDIDARADALENAENGYNDDDGNYVPGRVQAEKQRQINEFGAVGNKWNEDRTAVVDEKGNIIEDNNLTGRVGAELEREKAEATRKQNEKEREENEVARLKAEGSVDEGSEYYGGRALAEKERRDNEEMRKKFYETAFVGKKNDYDGAGVFNTEYNDANGGYNLANARAATTFGFNNRIVNNETDLKATYSHQFFEDDYIPKEDLDPYKSNESMWGRHSFLAGGNNVLTAYSGVGLGEVNKICGSRAVAIGFALRAYSAMQFICGKCNVPDYPLDGQGKKCNDSSLKGKYVFIVGNGNSNNPSNAFAVDWDGNAYISEELYIGKVSLTTKINNAIEKLINGAPGTMDLFAEIAELIGSNDKASTILGDIAKNANRISTAEALIEEHTKEIANLQAKLDNLVSAEGVSF